MEKRGLVLSVVLILAVAMFAGNLNSNNGVTGKPVLLQGTGKPVLLQKPAPAGEYDKDCVCSQKIEERCVTSCLNVPFDCKRGYTIVTSCSGKNECNISIYK